MPEKRSKRWTRAQALDSFRTGNPSTKAFEALSLPFEYFVRLASCHRSQDERQRICDGIVEHIEKEKVNV